MPLLHISKIQKKITKSLINSFFPSLLKLMDLCKFFFFWCCLVDELLFALISYENPIGVHTLRKILTTFCHASAIWPITHIKTSLKNLFFSLKEWVSFRSQHIKISGHIQIYCYSLFLENSLLSFPFSLFPDVSTVYLLYARSLEHRV